MRTQVRDRTSGVAVAARAGDRIAGRAGATLTARGRAVSRGAGFTLIELMITVAIVGILSVIAYPAYQDSVRKGKRAEGRSALLDFLQQQERFLSQGGSYSAVTAGQTGVPFKTFSGDNATSPSYKLSATACPGTPAPTLRECVQVNAIPQFTDDDFGTLWVLSTGTRGCSAGNPKCWR